MSYIGLHLTCDCNWAGMLLGVKAERNGAIMQEPVSLPVFPRRQNSSAFPGLSIFTLITTTLNYGKTNIGTLARDCIDSPANKNHRQPKLLCWTFELSSPCQQECQAPYMRCQWPAPRACLRLRNRCNHQVPAPARWRCHILNVHMVGKLNIKTDYWWLLPPVQNPRYSIPNQTSAYRPVFFWQ